MAKPQLKKIVRIDLKINVESDIESNRFHSLYYLFTAFV